MKKVSHRDPNSSGDRCLPVTNTCIRLNRIHACRRGLLRQPRLNVRENYVAAHLRTALSQRLPTLRHQRGSNKRIGCHQPRATGANACVFGPVRSADEFLMLLRGSVHQSSWVPRWMDRRTLYTVPTHRLRPTSIQILSSRVGHARGTSFPKLRIASLNPRGPSN